MEEKFIEMYVNYGNQSVDAIAKGYYKKNNKIVEEFTKFVEKNSNEEFFEDAIYKLMKNGDANTQLNASSDAIKYGVHEAIALKTIKKISKSLKYRNTLAQLHAEIFLEKLKDKTN